MREIPKSHAFYRVRGPVVRTAIAVCALIAAAFWTPPASAFSPKVMSSVVSVLPEWPDRVPRGAKGRLEEPEGTAVAISQGGYLATNAHVIGPATRLEVRLDDGRILPAEIVGRDPPTDIALIRVDADLPVPAFGPTPPLAAPVCAVGNQFGLGLSVTCGVVSAVHRTGTGFNPIEDFIQTDAAVNPGGSGGPLIDDKGRVIGLVSAIFTKRSDANIGVNFAASIRLVRRVVEDLKRHGRVIRGRLGLRVTELGKGERAFRSGVRVARVFPEGAAAKAGIRAGDVITAVADRTVTGPSDIPSAVHMYRVGEAFDITFVRDGETDKARVTLQP